MRTALLNALILCETDVAGALRRFSGNEALYSACLSEFLNDPTMEQLNKAIDAKLWDDAFTAAHALKGLAGNMGFIPLFHATAELVTFIRAGKLSEIDASNKHVLQCHNEISTAIRKNFDSLDAEAKGGLA